MYVPVEHRYNVDRTLIRSQRYQTAYNCYLYDVHLSCYAGPRRCSFGMVPVLRRFNTYTSSCAVCSVISLERHSTFQLASCSLRKVEAG